MSLKNQTKFQVPLCSAILLLPLICDIQTSCFVFKLLFFHYHISFYTSRRRTVLFVLAKVPSSILVLFVWVEFLVCFCLVAWLVWRFFFVLFLRTCLSWCTDKTQHNLSKMLSISVGTVVLLVSCHLWMSVIKIFFRSNVALLKILPL